MNEAPTFLLFAFLYGMLVFISLRYRHYKDKTERLEMENIQMAEKLGKDVAICQYCDEPMVKHTHNQKYHAVCNTQVNKDRIYAMYNKGKKQAKTFTMRNGVEILLNAFGKEISGTENNTIRLKSTRGRD